MSEQKIPIPAMLYNAAVGGHVCGPEDVDFGQKVVHLIKYDRAGNEVTFESQVTQANKIYVIHDDFVLSSDVTIPANCVLEFDGGSISGAYTLIGNNTAIVWDNKTPIFGNGVVIDSNGTWNVPYISSKMFANLNYSNSLKNVFALNNPNIQTTVVIEKESYNYTVSVNNNHESALKIVSNTEFILNGIIELETNSLDAYNVIGIESAKNIIIKGSGSIIGDYSSHTGITGEWGHCINVTASENIQIFGINCEQAWGDGIYIGSGLIGTPSNLVKIYNCTIHDCRRQGITVGYSSNTIITNNNIYNISGTNPQAAIDIECNANESINNVIIENNNIYDCILGIQSAAINTNTSVNNIYINNNIFNNVLYGVQVTKTTKNISIIGNKFKGTYDDGICLSEVDNAYIRNNIVENAVNKAFECVIVKKVIVINNIFKGSNIRYYSISNESEFCDNTFDGFFVSTNTCPKLVLRNNDIKINGGTGARLYAGVIEHNNIHYTNINGETGARIIRGNNIDGIIPEGSVNAINTKFNNVEYIKDNNIVFSGQSFIIFFINSKYDGAEHVDISNNNIKLSANAAHVVYGSTKVSGVNNVIDGTYTNVCRAGESNVVSPDTFVYHERIGTNRPSLNSQEIGAKFFDITLNKPIYWTGHAWVDATGATV